jgi:hypothetical protein
MQMKIYKIEKQSLAKWLSTLLFYPCTVMMLLSNVVDNITMTFIPEIYDVRAFEDTKTRIQHESIPKM